MFKPHWRITPFLLKTLEDIASKSSRVTHSGISASIKINLEKDVFIRSVHSSTWIEGNQLSLGQVAALSEHKKVESEERQKLEVNNCIRSLRWILKNPKKPLTPARLLKIHALMTENLLPKGRLGKYRDVQNYIVNAKNVVIFTPPAPVQVKQRMKDLFLWLEKSKEESAIIRSAVFHHEFVAIHPFVDGNGRTARAAAQWILLEKGLEPLFTLGVDEFFAQDRSRYYDMIQQTHDLDQDYTYWIEYVAQGMLVAVDKIADRLRARKISIKAPNVSLTAKQEELLKLIVEHGSIGSSEICKKMNITRARVNQLISPLVKAKIISRQGKARGVRYKLIDIVSN